MVAKSLTMEALSELKIHLEQKKDVAALIERYDLN
jgi:hypothetical protein